MQMKTGWTAGQYAIFRFALGAYLLVHFATLIPWAPELFSNSGALPDAHSSPLWGLFPNVFGLAASPMATMNLMVAATILSLLLALGIYDDIASIGLWLILASTVVRNPLISNPSLPYIGWILLAHGLCLSKRRQAASHWRMADGVYTAAWIIMATGYTYSGLMKLSSPSWLDGNALHYVLENPLAHEGILRTLLLSLPEPWLRLATWGSLALEIGFAPLAFSKRLRPWLWLAMTLMHISLLGIINFSDLSLGMLLLHFLTFDPFWIPAQASNREELFFFDGDCGLCNSSVQLVLAEDTLGRFKFAPLGGETFKKSLSASEQSKLPDSFVVLTDQNQILVRSRSILHICKRLGGLWRVFAFFLSAVPPGIADSVYNTVAQNRKRAGYTKNSCGLQLNMRGRVLS